MKLFDVKNQKNLFFYLTIPHFLKTKLMSNEDLIHLRQMNLNWNFKINDELKAPSYDERHGYTTKEGSAYPLLLLLARYFPPHASLGVTLEIGAGSGFVTAQLAKQAKRWVAIEFASPLTKQIEIMKGRLDLESVEIIQKSIYEVEFGEGQFDTVLLLHTLHHLVERKAVIQKIYRWLKPGGTVYVLDPRHNIQRIVQLVRKYVMIYRSQKVDEAWGTHDFVCKIELRNLLKSSGFRDIKIQSFDFPIISKLKRRDKIKQFEIESKINKISIIEHFGRFLFARAVK